MESSLSLSFSSVVETFVIMLSFAYGAVVVVVSVVSELSSPVAPETVVVVVSFGLKGGREAASAFMQNLKLGAIETHVADARTCCLNPATSTHRQMTDEQLKEAGVPAELIRISLGLEDKEDLIADISNALDAIRD